MASSSKNSRALIPLLILLLFLSGCEVFSPFAKPSPEPVPNPSPFPGGYLDDPTGLDIPDQLANQTLQAIIDYESKTPGLGTGLSFRSADSKLEFFIYTNGASIVPAGVDPPIVQEAFAKAIGDIEQAVEEGRYANYTLLSHRVKELGGQQFLKAEFSYSEQISSQRSVLYVTGFNTRIVKIRFTTQLDTNSNAAERIAFVESELAAVFQRALRKGYVGLTLNEVLKIQSDGVNINLDDGLNEFEAATISQIELIQKDLAGKWNLRTWSRFNAPSPLEIGIEFQPANRAQNNQQDRLRVTVDTVGRTQFEFLSKRNPSPDRRAPTLPPADP